MLDAKVNSTLDPFSIHCQWTQIIPCFLKLLQTLQKNAFIYCEQIVPIDKLKSQLEACYIMYQEKELCSNMILNIVIECSPSSEFADDIDLPDPEIFNDVSAFIASDNTNTISQSLLVSRSETVSTVAWTAKSFVESLGTSQINIPTSESWKRETIPNIIKLCSESNIVDPIEILRISQGQIIKGRKLE